MKLIEAVKNKITEARSRAQRLTDLRPTLERVDAVDARLPEIDEAQKVLALPVANDELATRIRAWVDRRRAEYIAAPIGTAANALYILEPLGRATAPEDPRLEPGDVWALLCALIPDTLKAGVPALVATRPDPRGLPSAKRPPLLEALVAERAALVAERRQLVDEVNATELVTLEHLKETQDAINAEATKKRDAEERAEHAARIEEWKRTQGHPIARHQASMYPDRWLDRR